jgi:hypothetical protein
MITWEKATTMRTEPPPPPDKIPDLLRFERVLLVAVIFGAFAVGSLGLVASFETVGNAAREWGFHPFWVLPVSIDTAIPVFSLSHLLLIRADMPLGWVRAVPWSLTAVTVYLNVAAAGDSLAAKLGHGALPLLWVVCSEIAAHVYRSLIGAVTGRRMERVRRSRWILSPVQTLRLWRRMILWEVTSYRTGLALERDRQLARAELREKYGRRWRWKTPRRERVLLALGELAPTSVATEVIGATAHPLPIPTIPAQALPPSETVGASSTATSDNAPRSIPDAVEATSDSSPTAPAAAVDNSAPSGKRRKRRSMEEWVELAGPVFHSEFTRLRRQPTGDEFATAIELAGYGAVSASTAKNIRTAILDVEGEKLATR